MKFAIERALLVGLLWLQFLAASDDSVGSVDTDTFVTERISLLEPENLYASDESDDSLDGHRARSRPAPSTERRFQLPPPPVLSRTPSATAAAAAARPFGFLDLKFRRAQSVRRLRRPFPSRRARKIEYFQSTTPFVHGDTVFGLGRTTSGILYIYLTVMFAVYVLSTTVLLFHKRRDPSLSKFPLWLSHFIPAGLNILIVALGFIRHMFRAKYPCFLVLWTYGLLAPMYVIMILQGRSLSLLFEYHWNKRMQALLQASESRAERSPKEDVVIVLPRARELDPHQTRYINDWLWIKRYGMLTTMVGLFAAQFVMTLAIQILSPHYRIWPKMVIYRCAGLWETILPMVALLMHLFIIPLYLFIQLRRINDSCGVRQDIYAAVTQSAWMAVFFTLLRHVYFIGKFVGYCPTGFAIMFTFGILHYHTVCAPLLRVYQWQWSRSRVKKRMRKYYLIKRRIEAVLFPRALRIKIPKSFAQQLKHQQLQQQQQQIGHQTRQEQDPQILIPQPIKGGPVLVEEDHQPRSRRLRFPFLSRLGGFQNRNNDCASNNNNNSNHNNKHNSNSSKYYSSPADSLRAESAASPAASHLSPELRPPTFQQVLQDETLCELFERYTLLEFSRENLLFYRAVCALRSTHASLPPAAAKIFLTEKSKNLYAQFICQNSPAEVNIPGPARKRIETRIAEMDIDLTLFDEAQREVFKLMQSWSYPRFLRTLPEAEIRRFNRKAARRNSITEAASAAAAHSNSVAMPSMPTIQSPDYNFSTSMTSFTMPSEIAHVSLSSSP